MKNTYVLVVALTVLCGLSSLADAREEIRLPSRPDLSPDGSKLVFSWRGDIWIANIKGGNSRQLTTSPARELAPKFSPDAKVVAFLSDRAGATQVFVTPVQGGAPKQLTFHSEGCGLEQWASDGASLLISGSRDHYWRKPDRFFMVANKPPAKEQLMFDAYGAEGRLSPDGKRLLFTREGVRWWRKGHVGSQASQVWIYDVASKNFEQLCDHESGARTPLWHPDGKHFFYVGGQNGAFNLYRRHIESGKEQQLTEFEDDSVVNPCISADGGTIVFRHRFDLYRLNVKEGGKPKRLKLFTRSDVTHDAIQRRTLSAASEVSFSKDGLEVAFIAGGDLWVMDTVLREPKQISNTPQEERQPAFSPDGSSILYVSDAGEQSDIWRAKRKNEEDYWWRNEKFVLERVTNDSHVEEALTWSPDGKRISFVQGSGDLWVMDADGKNAKRLFESWNEPDYDWSPDSKWIAYGLSDNDFNRDIYLLPVDGSRPPFNLSRHPDNDYGPVWSPDGKMVAFAGRRIGTETDIYFVQLQKSEDEVNSRDRKLKQALEKISKARKKSPKKAAPAKSTTPAKKTTPQESDPKKADKPAGSDAKSEAKAKPAEKPATTQTPKVSIDFDGIANRIRRISIPDASESSLFWSHDSKRLAFTATVNGRSGLYTISPPASLTPKLLSTTTGSNAKWLAAGNQIVWLVGGKPSSLSTSGTPTNSSFTFSARQAVDVAARHHAAFQLCWREMRDNWYDARLNNRNWDEIRRKYAPLAKSAVDPMTLSTVVNMMLGELNGSHLGFFPSRSTTTAAWRDTTAHFGVRYDFDHKGPGLKIKDVIRKSPADLSRSRLAAGEVILSIDGTDVDPDMELTKLLNGPRERDMVLKVKNEMNVERNVTIRPISYSTARSLLYEQWIYDNQQQVKELAKGKLGYVHIRGMNMTSFYRFEKELYSVAAGKDGLIIDVRENGGGSTTDHLLTILTQPRHAITVPRGGGPGYPQDRRVYATWSKPIVVLCNQNSFSNAEIFSHAIKTLKRGQLVGTPTAGGVISTGGTRIMDVGILSKPFRGWFLLDGQDMELNGAVPHHILWPHPGDMPRGKDDQLHKAIDVLQKDVEAWRNRPAIKRVKASERRAGKEAGKEALPR